MNQLKQIIEGKTSVKVETQSPTGKEYNTNTPELKPTRITTANGDVYGFVKKSETSDPESGELKEGVITVEYVYRKVVTTYVDETGKKFVHIRKELIQKKQSQTVMYVMYIVKLFILNLKQKHQQLFKNKRMNYQILEQEMSLQSLEQQQLLFLQDQELRFQVRKKKSKSVLELTDHQFEFL